MLRFPSDEQLNQATVVMAFTKALLISRKGGFAICWDSGREGVLG